MTLGFVPASEEDSVSLSILCPEWMKVKSHLNGCPSFSRNSTVLCQALPCDVPSTLSSPRDSQDFVPHMLWPLLWAPFISETDSGPSHTVSRHQSPPLPVRWALGGWNSVFRQCFLLYPQGVYPRTFSGCLKPTTGNTPLHVYIHIL